MLSSSGILVKFITFYCVKQLKPESFCYTRLSNRPAGLTVHWYCTDSPFSCQLKTMRPADQPVSQLHWSKHCPTSSSSLFSFFVASQTRKRPWWRTEHPRPFFFFLWFRFLMQVNNEKDDDGEQNTLGLSSSCFVFVFWCPSKTKKTMMANRIP